MVTALRPVSSQSSGKSKRSFQQALQHEASAVWQEAPLRGTLYVRVVWFRNAKSQGDIDNVVKPILDAFKNRVFDDDEQIVLCLAQRVDVFRDYTLSASARTQIPNQKYEEMEQLIADNHPHILYIKIGAMPHQVVTFGPIEEGSS